MGKSMFNTCLKASLIGTQTLIFNLSISLLNVMKFLLVLLKKKKKKEKKHSQRWARETKEPFIYVVRTTRLNDENEKVHKEK